MVVTVLIIIGWITGSTGVTISVVVVSVIVVIFFPPSGPKLVCFSVITLDGLPSLLITVVLTVVIFCP